MAATEASAPVGISDLALVSPEDVPEDAAELELDEASAPHLSSVCLGVLTLLAVIYSLYLGRDLLMPIVMAAVLSLLLRPLTRALETYLRLPTPLAALVAIVFAAVLVVYVAYFMSPPSDGWLGSAPQTLSILKERLGFLSAPISYVQDALHNIENIGAGADMKTTVMVAGGSELPGVILFGAASTIRQLFITVLILYFMLASGDRLLRAFIEVLPRFADKRRAVEIAMEIQSSIASYLLTVTAMNAGVGVLAGASAAIFGLSNPLLWGAIAFLLNFVPIIGPLMGILVFFVIGVATLPWPLPALGPVMFYAGIHFVEGQLVTPHLVARKFELNPVVVIVSLLFWDAIWGVPGAILSLPLLAILKIIADRIDRLKSLGHLIAA